MEKGMEMSVRGGGEGGGGFGGGGGDMGHEWCIRGRRLDEELLRNVPVDRWGGGGGGLYSLVVDIDMT